MYLQNFSHWMTCHMNYTTGVVSNKYVKGYLHIQYLHLKTQIYFLLCAPDNERGLWVEFVI